MQSEVPMKDSMKPGSMSLISTIVFLLADWSTLRLLAQYWRAVGLHDVAVHGELVDVLHVVGVPHKGDEASHHLMEGLFLSLLHFHVEKNQ